MEGGRESEPQENRKKRELKSCEISWLDDRWIGGKRGGSGKEHRPDTRGRIKDQDSRRYRGDCGLTPWNVPTR